MTANRRHRRRAAVVAVLTAVIGVVTAAGLGYAGANTVLNSAAGSDVGLVAADRPDLPFSPVALIGVVDDDDRLTSAVVIGLQPDGTGGYLVPLAATASTLVDGEARPLSEAYSQLGPEAFAATAESIAAVGFDVVEIVDAERLAELVSPLGEFEVEVPFDVFDESTGTLLPGGDERMSPQVLAELLTASDLSIEDWYYEPARQAAWDAVARRIGAGVGSVEPVSGEGSWPVPVTLDDFLGRLFASTTESRPLGFDVIDDPAFALPDAPAGVPAAVIHDRAETLMVMSVVAPARIGAPLEGLTVRIIAPRGDLDASEQGAAVRDLIDDLLAAEQNVVSVVLVPGDVPDSTRVASINADRAELAAQALAELSLGASSPSDIAIDATIPEGVEVLVTVGADWYMESNE